MNADWGLVVNIFVAVGTIALATTAFAQARHSVRGQQARAKAALADGVYLPVRLELEAICEAEKSRWVHGSGAYAPSFRAWPDIKKNKPIMSIQVPERLTRSFDSVAAATQKHREAVEEFYRLATPRFGRIMGQNHPNFGFEIGLNVRFGPSASLSTTFSPREVLEQTLEGGGFAPFLSSFEHQYPDSDLTYQIHQQQDIIAEGYAALERIEQAFKELESLQELNRCIESAEALAQEASFAWQIVQSELSSVARLVQRHHA